MGIDFNTFKNNFFAEMKRAANLDSADGKINTDLETKEANNIQSTFKAKLSNVSIPIGDTIEKSTDIKGQFDEVTFEDFTKLLDDPELNIGRVNELIEEKPVTAETRSGLNNVGTVEEPKELQTMAEMSDADTEGVKFHTDLAIVSGRDKEIDYAIDGYNLVGDTFNYSPKYLDGFNEGIYRTFAA